jgi:hypothetical protein
MNLKDLISKISTETLLPAGEVHKVTVSVLEALRENVEVGENFTSPRLNIRAITTKPTEKIDESGVKIAIPERKIGRLIPKEPNPKV